MLTILIQVSLIVISFICVGSFIHCLKELKKYNPTKYYTVLLLIQSTIILIVNILFYLKF